MAVVALSKALDDMTLERDAALAAKEDLLSQLRVAKRRLKEAEDEQYKAEEDAATLRSEIQAMQHSEQKNNYMPSSFIPDQQEIASMKSELEETWQRLQQEQLKLATEQKRNSLLTSKIKDLEKAKQEAETTLAGIQNNKPGGTESASVTVPLSGASSLDDTGTSSQKNSKLEMQLHELASMVERLEKGRQKLLGEIDVQSAEIERLFVENANLTSSVEETSEIASQWESQVQQCLEHNAQLRSELNQLRMQQAMVSASEQIVLSEKLLEKGGQAPADDAKEIQDLENLRRDNSKLKVELAKVQAREVEQTAQIAQLSSNLNRAILASNTLGRLYRPVLSNIENRLLQLKQYNSISDTSLP
ncbi:unnamed protein product [Calypogeia fissa]